MSKFLTVLQFHLAANYRSKAFMTTIIVTFFLVLGVIGAGHWFSNVGSNDTYAIITDTSTKNLPIKEWDHQLKNIDLDEKSNKEKVKSAVLDGTYDGALSLTNKNGQIQLTYYVKNEGDETDLQPITMMVKQYVTEKNIQKNKLSSDVTNQLLNPLTEKTQALKDHSNTTWFVYVLNILIYILLIGFGQSIANNVAAEKTSRVMEIMISKVKPITMLYAKIASTLIVGLSSIAVYGIAIFISYLLGWISSDRIKLFGAVMDVSGVTPSVIIYFIIYFLLGLILYTLLYATLGSIVSRTEDLASVLLPATLLLLGSFYIGIRATFSPDSLFIAICSYIPFFSPISAFSRVVAGEAPFYETILSISILIASILLLSLFANRVYVNGVMSYKGKVTYKDVFKLARKQ